MIALGIGGLAVLVAIVVPVLYARAGWRAGMIAAGLIGGQMLVQWRVADNGVLHQWTVMPPPIAPMILAGLLTALLGALRPAGGRLLAATPLAVIVAIQVFRLPLELFMHQAAVSGLMPMQMSYEGTNFDIVTGASALPVAALLAMGRCPRGVLMAWNAVGSVLLVTIMSIGIVSTPTFAAFGPDRLNTFVADVPFVWLPGILVPTAAWGHLLIWRSLLTRRTPR